MADSAFFSDLSIGSDGDIDASFGWKAVFTDLANQYSGGRTAVVPPLINEKTYFARVFNFAVKYFPTFSPCFTPISIAGR